MAEKYLNNKSYEIYLSNIRNYLNGNLNSAHNEGSVKEVLRNKMGSYFTIDNINHCFIHFGSKKIKVGDHLSFSVIYEEGDEIQYVVKIYNKDNIFTRLFSIVHDLLQ